MGRFGAPRKEARYLMFQLRLDMSLQITSSTMLALLFCCVLLILRRILGQPLPLPVTTTKDDRASYAGRVSNYPRNDICRR